MKHIFTISFLLIAFLSFSQDYKLFNSSSRKVFTNYPIPDSTFSIAFDSATLAAGDSVYYNFLQTGNIITSSSCQFWGPPECTRQDRPTWLGSKIIFNNLSGYKFYTSYGEILNFDFSVGKGDSALFYQSPAEKFYITLTKSDTITVLNYPDSARFYTIIHTDLSGNTINSPLNQQKIIIAKNLGLVQFFQIDAFPLVLNPVYLLGNVSPDLGMARLSYETLNEHSVGDEIQYQVNMRYNYPSPDNKEQYIKYSFLAKTITTDSIIYQVNRTVFDKGSSISTDDVVYLKYQRNSGFAEIPYDYNKPSDFGFFVTKRFYLKEYCGSKLWTYHVNQNRGLRYCTAENCWGSNDVPGPAPLEDTVYALGLGIYSSVYSDAFLTPPPSQDYSVMSNIIYFKKNGLICGNEAILGIEENAANDNLFTVYPVPATNYILVETDLFKGNRVSVYTANGLEVINQTLDNKLTRLDISALKSGIYLVKFVSDKNVSVKRFVKE